MTTTVRVMIEGNKACEVKVTGPGATSQGDAVTVQPGAFTTKFIHGEQVLSVQEVGEFVNQP